MNINQDTINKYRQKHRRCKTCVYENNERYYWYCKAKQKMHCGDVKETIFAGCFCKLYTPKLFI